MGNCIENIHARQILDSRGTPTVEVEVQIGSVCARASVPSGASTGSYEAVELRDNKEENYCGKSVLMAVKNVNEEILPVIVGEDITNQQLIDEKMITLDATNNKSRLGANAILGVSLACVKASAKINNKELFEYLNADSYLMPVPMMNVLNGGKHADSNLNIQEFMIMPVGAPSYSEGLRWSVEVFHTLKKLLKEKHLSTSVGDEGGFAPNLKNDEEAFSLLVSAITKAGYRAGKDFCIAIDVASTEMWNEAEKIGKSGSYYFWKTGEIFTSTELVDYYESLCQKYPIISIEDGLAEEDWDNWKALTERLGDRIQLVGDDLFVTNVERIKKGIQEKVANAVLIKPNQIGTVTETLSAIKLAHDNGYRTIISHRSGETEDTSIVHIAVACKSGQIKIGAPSRTDRVCKYNELLRIEEKLNTKAKYNNPFE